MCWASHNVVAHLLFSFLTMHRHLLFLILHRRVACILFHKVDPISRLDERFLETPALPTGNMQLG